MTIAPKFTIQQVAVEVQYERGVVYFDKCGSLMLKLVDQLGEPFQQGDIPGMQFGEVRNIAERITVRYGPSSMNLTQLWPAESPVRLEQLAPVAWNEVSTQLGVRGSVTRCGARFWLLWKADSLEEAREGVQAAQLLTVNDRWREVFADSKPRGWVIMTTEAHGQVRIALDAAETNVQASALPADLTDVVPKFSILLDLDYFRGGVAGSTTGARFTLQEAQLKEFIRTSWQRTKVAATVVGGLLQG